MSRKIPPLNWLRAFESSARHLSFTAAAQELGLTQTAISKQVKNLELHFHVLLFQRRARSLILTKAGETYLPKVRDAFDRLSVGTEEVFGNRQAELLTIRVSVGFSAYWLGPKIGDFRTRYPSIDFRIVSSVWNNDADESDVDLEIRYGSGDWPGFKCERLTIENIFPICHPKLMEGIAPLKHPEDLESHTLLHVDGYEEGWATWLKAADLPATISGTGLHFDTSILSFEMAKTSHGVALGRSSLTSIVLAEGRLVAPFDLVVPIKEGFHLLTPKRKSIHPDAQYFTDWVLEQVRCADKDVS